MTKPSVVESNTQQVSKPKRTVPSRLQYSKKGLLAWIANNTSVATTEQDFANRASHLNIPTAKH